MSLTEPIACWRCRLFAVAKAGKKEVVLDCGHASFGKHGPEHGFYHENCPFYIPDPEVNRVC